MMPDKQTTSVPDIEDIHKEYVKGQEFQHFEHSAYTGEKNKDPIPIVITLCLAVVSLVASLIFLLVYSDISITGMATLNSGHGAGSIMTSLAAMLIAAVSLGAVMLQVKGMSVYYSQQHARQARCPEPDSLIAEAESLLQQDKRKAAIGLYDQVLEADPGNSKALLNKGFVFDMMGRHRDAMLAYDKILEDHPEDRKALYNKGFSLMQMNRLTEAKKCFSRALKLDSKDVPTIRRLCFIHLSRKEYDKAVSLCERVLKFDRRNIDMLIIKGLSLERMSRKKQALKAFDAALRIDPQDAWAFRCRNDIIENNPRLR